MRTLIIAILFIFIISCTSQDNRQQDIPTQRHDTQRAIQDSEKAKKDAEDTIKHADEIQERYKDNNEYLKKYE